MHRLFVAIRPPTPIRAQLLGVMGGIVGARWQDDLQLHLTLRFIGEVDSHVADDVAAALGAVRQTGFEIALDGIGKFDRRGRTDALWAGVAPHDELEKLHKKVDQALVRLGLPPEGRAYLPHITLARMNASAGRTDRFLESHAGLASAPFVFDHFLLFESTLGREGAIYEAIERYPLRV